MTVAVVGAGLGGLRTVEHLRRRGFLGAITLIGAETHPPYDRPPLTKQVLRGERDATALREELDSLDVHLRLGIRATALHPAASQIDLDDGTALDYGIVVLAPGARPRKLPGVAERPGLHVVRTIDDALRLRAAVPAGGEVTVIGGGFIGCEVAASLRSIGVEVDLVELLAHPLARVLGPAGGELVETLLVDHGVRVHTGVAVTRVLGEGRVAGVELADGTVLAAPEVVVALGVVPDTEWLSGSGVRVDDGVVCDVSGRTSVSNVYAVGDAARWQDAGTGRHRRVEHWTTTGDQAAVVAAAISGEPAVLTEVPYFWSDQFDIKIQALGHVDPTDDVKRLDVNGRPVFLYSREGVLQSVVGFSAARAVMRLRPLIAAGAAVGEAEALLTR